MKLIMIQLRTELRLMLRNGEQLLLILGIPVFLLVFFGTLDVLPMGEGDRLEFLVPGILAVSVISTSMVSLGISTGFQRSYGVFVRLGLTPIGTNRLVAAKALSIGVVEALQMVLVGLIAVIMGWSTTSAGLAVALIGVPLGTLAFTGIGLALAGRLRAELNLAAQNGLYLVLLLTSGMIIADDSIPSAINGITRWLPAQPLAQILREHLAGNTAPLGSWLVLGAWGALAPIVAARFFRWSAGN
jgi:ABC-2 type transport system permease protein